MTVINVYVEAIDTADLRQRLQDPRIKREISQQIQQSINGEGAMRRAVSRAAKSQL